MWITQSTLFIFRMHWSLGIIKLKNNFYSQVFHLFIHIYSRVIHKVIYFIHMIIVIYIKQRRKAKESAFRLSLVYYIPSPKIFK